MPDLLQIIREASEAASDLHGARLAKDSEAEYGDHVDLYEHIMDFEKRFPFAEIKAALDASSDERPTDGKQERHDA